MATKFVPSFQVLSDDERQAITGFSFLWSLFEAKALMLETLKAEKLRIERWRESIQMSAEIKVMIDDSLQWLPQKPYPEEELGTKSLLVYQHIYANYQGGGLSAYGEFLE